MSKVILLKELKKFTEAATRGIILPVRPTEEEPDPQPRPPFVYRMRLPKFRDATRKAPYILHQVLTGKDIQAAGTPLDSSALVRTVFCVYHQDEEEGALSLLNLMESLRIALLERPVICQRGSPTGPFALDLNAGLETLAYPDNREPRSAPFCLGEMISTWRMEPVRRLDVDRIIHGAPPWDPNATHFKEILNGKGDLSDDKEDD